MVLVDTSVWIDHFRYSDENLRVLLREDQVVIHPMIIGELACGNLRNRQVTLALLYSLQKPKVATDHEAYLFIETEKLYGAGIGFLDVHLLCACRLTASQLWTRDKALLGIAERLGLAFETLTREPGGLKNLVIPEDFDLTDEAIVKEFEGGHEP